MKALSASAIVSDCGMFRYSLGRVVADEGQVVGFFGVNPSTADAYQDDQTVRKWIGFASRMGARKFLVGNVFAYRATDVRELSMVLDPVGPDNRSHLDAIVAECDVLVPCWGNQAKVPRSIRHRIDEVLKLLVRSGKPVLCFGKTQSGDPKHPLTLSYATEMIDWETP